MKFAAFISIIVSVAVMFVACQGAVGPEGPKGDKGDKGDTGDTGDTGTPGTPGTDGVPGISALVAKPNPAAILINDAMEDGNTVIGALPTALNASAYFRGGNDPITYTSTRVDSTADDAVTDADNNSFNLAVDMETGAIAVTELETPSTDQDNPYTVGDHFTITAKDADGFTATTEVIKVQRNRAPTKATTGVVVDAAATANALIPGNQDAIQLDANNKEQTSTDACDVTDKDRLNVVCFTKDQVVAAFGADGDTGVTYSVRSKNPANASAAIASDGRLIITGHSPLMVNDAVADIKIFLKATDTGGLASEEHEILVRVDPMPVIGALPTTVSVKSTGAATAGVIRNITTFLTNADAAGSTTAEALTITLVDADGTAADASTSNAYFSAEIASDGLNITGNNVTTSPIALTLLIKEPAAAPSQWVKHTIMVSVIPS